MKKLILLSFVIVSVLFLVSCAFHSGVITGNAEISDANFKVIEFASGTAKTTRIFGIGGLRKDALVLEAKKDLYASHPLKNGQAMANVTVDFKNSFWLVVHETKVTVTAEIIDFNQDDSDFSYANKIHEDFIPLKRLTGENFRVKDTVNIKIDSGMSRAVIYEVRKEKVLVKHEITENVFKMKYVTKDQLVRWNPPEKN